MPLKSETANATNAEKARPAAVDAAPDVKKMTELKDPIGRGAEIAPRSALKLDEGYK